MSNLKCAECKLLFDANANLNEDGYWICPHCHAVLQEAEP